MNEPIDQVEQPINPTEKPTTPQILSDAPGAIFATEVLIILFILIIAVNLLVLPLVNIWRSVPLPKLPDQFWTFCQILIPSHLGLKAINIHLPGFLDKYLKK
jgi:hypothetical protein